MNQTRIRNFAIIAHIDHGKSTLADRMLEMTHTVAMRDMSAQHLDSNPIERERGITIKLAPVRMVHRFKNKKQSAEIINHKSLIVNPGTELMDGNNQDDEGENYILNLIDTPGHVDFSYEVSRSLAACEGAILVVDATQGVQAQTLAHLHQARLHKLAIIPVINKIDMPGARIAETTAELLELGFTAAEILTISAKVGTHVDQVLDAIVRRIPPPHGDESAPLRALVFSSQYDTHKGVVVFVRVVDGRFGYDPQSGIRFMASNAEVTPIETGYFMPGMMSAPMLSTGEVGYIATGLKDIRFAKVGDTITEAISHKSKVISHTSKADLTVDADKSEVPSAKLRTGISQNSEINETVGEEYVNHKSKIINQVHPLPGYKEPKPMVFLGLFPLSADEFTRGREAMEKLRLSDSAFTFKPISSMALGNGFHCGFLGLLHAEVVQERILREFDLTMIATAPSVEYRIKVKSQKSRFKIEEDGFMHIQSATELPDPTYVEEVREPVMEVKVYTPRRYVGAVMQLAQEKRGEYIDLVYHADPSFAKATEGEKTSDMAIEGIAELTYLIPLAEMIIDFFDRLKSVTEGYASLDYEFFEHQAVEVAKVDILVNKEKVDAFSFLAVRVQAAFRGREMVERLAGVIPRQQFGIPIQAAIGGAVIARADVKPFRKDVIQKLYGGDRTRKDKLLKKQKKGKAKMKLIGSVEIPQSAFFEVLKRE